MGKYRFLEHTADAFYQAFGKSFQELLLNSAEAMCSVMCELESVEAKEGIEVNVKGEDSSQLLHNFSLKKS